MRAFVLSTLENTLSSVKAGISKASFLYRRGIIMITASPDRQKRIIDGDSVQRTDEELMSGFFLLR